MLSTRRKLAGSISNFAGIGNSPPKWCPSPRATCRKLLTLFGTCGCHLESAVIHGKDCVHAQENQVIEDWKVTMIQSGSCVDTENIWKIRVGREGICPVCTHRAESKPNGPRAMSSLWKGHVPNDLCMALRDHFQKKAALQEAAKMMAVRERHREISAAFWVHASRLWETGELELEASQVLWKESFGYRVYCCEIKFVEKGQVSLHTRSWEQTTFNAPLSKRLDLGNAKNVPKNVPKNMPKSEPKREPEGEAKPAPVRRQYRCFRCQDFPIPEGCGECD